MNTPSISVLVVAHNEEDLIGKCLDSLLKQTLPPDEILVVAHNCTDRTEEIVSKYQQIKLVSYQSARCPIYARIKGFESVTGEIVVCIDGDGYADKNWVEKMTAPLHNSTVSGVGGVVMFTNILSRRFLSTYFFHLVWLAGFFDKRANCWAFWGPSMAFRTKDYFAIGGLEPLIKIRAKLKLIECPDDFYIAVKLREIGKIVTVLGTTVRAISKEGDSFRAMKRAHHQQEDGKKLQHYLMSN